MRASALHLGYVESFKGADGLVLLGDQAALQELATRLEHLANGKEATLELHSLPGVEPHGVELGVVKTESESGLVRHGNTFAWRQGAKVLKCFAVQVQTLAQEGQGHVYLEGLGKHCQVMISCNEYDDSIFERTGA